MFSKRDCILFFVAGLLVTFGFISMVADPVDNGFGSLTLWVAPPLLLAGFLLPILGIAGAGNLSIPRWRDSPVKHFAGLFVFLFSLIVYVCTLEPTASLWDCSEFIASAYKLQVPHTPGTPLSLLIGRVFTMFAFGDVAKVAWTLNFMSSVFSACCVYLLFQIIFYAGQQVIPSGDRYRRMLIISSIGGSLCLAFSDTFWFSAVEAETYGPASFFLLLLVWLILTGSKLTEPLRTRRLIMIFYLAGLSYCIHPMCLLAMPMLPLAWGFKPGMKATTLILLAATGMATVFLINRFIVIGFFEVVFSFDLLFVNKLRLPFYSGPIVFILAAAVLFRIAILKVVRARPYLWSLIFLMFGFLPYLVLFIRSNHNPPIDEANPENLPMIKAYMNRESYPSSPLIYGPYFDASIQDVVVKKKIYYQDAKDYQLAGTLPEYVYDRRQTLLPRMYSNDASHIETYRSWTGLKQSEKPSFTDNLLFMFKYQIGHMYFRYFMWNFAGRAGDVQHSDWLNPWESLSGSRFDRARNQYWMIPLLLGFAGALFQFRRDRATFLSNTIFFLITGLILAIYLNGTPGEPRERDYIYVGSFLAYCIWIGMGMVSLAVQSLRIRWAAVLIPLITLGLPLWMLYQNYGDHNRSGRTFQVDHAKNILNSCAPNSILFTGGDNDTFPLWYVQEVEGFRTDVRVMVLSYMNTDWYINQLRKTYYDSGSFTLALDENDYRQYGPNDVLYVQETIKEPIDARQFLELLKKEHPALRRVSAHGEPYHILPSRHLKIAGMESSSVGEGKSPSSPTEEEMILQITENYVSKNLLGILDLVVSNKWERPIYFNFTSLNTLGIDVSSYVVQEGPVFRLRPVRNAQGIAVDTSLSYRNIVEQADYSNLRDSRVYFSYEDHFARMIVPIRQSFNDLAEAFLNNGNPDMARKVLSKAFRELHQPHLPPSYTNVETGHMLLSLGEKEMAHAICTEAFDYYFGLVRSSLADGMEVNDLDKYLLRQVALLLEKSGDRSFQDRVNGLPI